MLQIVLCDGNAPFLCALRGSVRSILQKHKVTATVHTFEDPRTIPKPLLFACDLFFLEIHYPHSNCNGLHAAQAIRNARPDAIIIFVTSLLEYAPEGYEVQAFRYLLKDSYRQKLEACLLQAVSSLADTQDILQLSFLGETISIPLDDILYVVADGHYVTVHTLPGNGTEEKPYRIYSTISEMEERLSHRGFLRTQRSYLVNMRRIRRLHCAEVLLDTGALLPVSRKSYAAQKQKFLQWKGVD